MYVMEKYPASVLVDSMHQWQCLLIKIFIVNPLAELNWNDKHK